MKNRLINALHRLPLPGDERTGRLSQRAIFAIAAGVLVVLLALATGLFLKHQSGFVPENNVDTLDIERSQVYLTGVGYAIDKKQKDDHDEIEDQLEDIDDIEEDDLSDSNNRRFTPPTYTPRPRYTPRAGSRYSYNGNRKRTTKSQKSKTKKSDKSEKKSPGTGNPDEKAPEGTDPDDVRKPSGGDSGNTEEEDSRKPTVKTSIVDGEKVEGTRYDFWITATDYKGNNIPVYSVGEGKFSVSCNGTTLSSTGESGKKTSFRAELQDGKNTFEIKAEDSEGRKRTVSRWVDCNAAGEAEKVGTVSVTISADILGLGTIYSTEVEIEKGDSVKDAMKAAFAEGGYTGSFSGSYLAGISKKNIAKNAHISDDVRAEMEERRKTEKDPDKQDKNSLKEHDFYDSSGWLYSVNGDFPDVGTGSYKLEDGDEVAVIFALDTGVY